MTFLPTTILLLAWLGTESGLAPAPFPSERSPELEIAASLELRPLEARELLQGTPSRALEAQASAFSLAEPMRIEREVPVVWEMWLPKDARPERLLVEYEVISPSGERDRLGHRSRSVSALELRLVPLPPEVVGETDDRILVRGAVRLELDVERLRFAGTYEGTLSVTVRER